MSWRNAGQILVQVGATPIFMLFIFGKLLGSTGFVSAQYGPLMLLGVVALSAFLSALQDAAFTLSMEFAWTKEIEDRLLAPLPVALLATEKVLVSSLHGLLAATIIYPVGGLVLGTAPWRADGVPLLVGVLVLGAVTGAGIGVTMGSLVPPARIGVWFGLILTTVLFTGATYYPWHSLATVPWFQVITAANPLTYCAEGIRAAMLPEQPHLSPLACVIVLVCSAVLFLGTSVSAFRRRAIG